MTLLSDPHSFINGDHRKKKLHQVFVHVIHLQDFYSRKARRMLLEAMLDVDTGSLEVAVEACKQFSLPDDDPEFRGGKNRLAFLQSRRGEHLTRLCVYF